MKPHFAKFMAGAALAACFGAPALADITGAAEGVLACREVEGDMAKLACYEAAAGVLETALAHAPVAAAAETAATPEPVDPALAAEAKLPIWARLSLGAQEEQAKARRQNSDEEQPAETKELEVTVVKIVRNNVGRHYLYFSDGQVWKQSRPEKLEAPSSLPAPATMRRALTGNPWFQFDEHPSSDFKITRVK